MNPGTGIHEYDVVVFPQGFQELPLHPVPRTQAGHTGRVPATPGRAGPGRGGTHTSNFRHSSTLKGPASVSKGISKQGTPRGRDTLWFTPTTTDGIEILRS